MCLSSSEIHKMESEQELGARAGRPRPNSALFDPISAEPPPKVAQERNSHFSELRSLCVIIISLLGCLGSKLNEYEFHNAMSRDLFFSLKPSKLLGNTLPRITPYTQQVCFSFAFSFIHAKLIFQSVPHSSKHSLLFVCVCRDKSKISRRCGSRRGR